MRAEEKMLVPVLIRRLYDTVAWLFMDLRTFLSSANSAA